MRLKGRRSARFLAERLRGVRPRRRPPRLKLIRLHASNPVDRDVLRSFTDGKQQLDLLRCIRSDVAQIVIVTKPRRRSGTCLRLRFSATNRLRVVAAGDTVADNALAHAPEGAYLTEREWRRLGHYDVPPDELASYLIWIDPASAADCLVEVPWFMQEATVFLDGRLRAQGVPLPATPGELVFNSR